MIASLAGSAAPWRRTTSGSDWIFTLTTVLMTVYIVNRQYSAGGHRRRNAQMTDTIHELVRERYAGGGSQRAVA